MLSRREVPTHRTLNQVDELYRSITQALTHAERLAYAEREVRNWDRRADEFEASAVEWSRIGQIRSAAVCRASASQYRAEADAWREIATGLELQAAQVAA